MVHITRRFALPLSLVFALAIGACQDNDDDNPLAQDTTLNRDLELANRDTAAQPALTDVPAAETPAPAPAATAPAPRTTPPRTTTPRTVTRAPVRAPTRTTTTTTAPRTTTSGNVVRSTPAAAPERRTGVIAAGTNVTLSSGSRICTNTHRVGQTFTATVSNTVMGSNGAAIPAGATATVEITELRRSNNVNDPIQIGLRVRSITFGGRTYAVSATTQSAQVDRVSGGSSGRTARNVAAGAAIGAAVGQVLGRDTRSTVAGAAVGAAAGAGAAAATTNFDGCVPVGGRIAIELGSNVEVVV